MNQDGQRLRAARIAAGLSQSQVARELGIRTPTVSDWERGLSAPRPVMIPRLARLYQVTPFKLLGVDPAAPTIAALRLARGLTLADVADAIGVSVMTYRRIELGQVRDPEERLWPALAQVFDVPVDTVRAAFARR